jgi:formiminoglutamase
VTSSTFPNDPLWPRAGLWLTEAARISQPESDIALIGIPAFRSSISPTGAHATPTAIREALMRYSTHAGSRGIDLADLTAVDLGDVPDPDGPEGEERVRAAVSAASSNQRLLIALGGDNSATYSVMRGIAGERLGEWGLVTVDAHHDLRDGTSNGSPVRRLIEAGLPGTNVVQVGIADFANSAAYAKRATEHGITVVHRAELRDRAMDEVAGEALAVAGRGGRPVYVDLDVDVCDRAAVPGCPAAAPGGITADELRELAFAFGRDARVNAVDITEVDALADAPDGRTVRLAALLVLEIATGLAARAR